MCSHGYNATDICLTSAFSVLKEIEFSRCLQIYGEKRFVLFFGRSSLLPASPEFTSTVGVMWEQSQTGRYCWLYDEDLSLVSIVLAIPVLRLSARQNSSADGRISHII